MNKTIVTLPCRTIRAMAWRMGKSQYGKCVWIVFSCMVAASLPTYLVSSFFASDILYEIASILELILSMIFSLGIITYFLAVFRGEQGTADHVASAFDNGGKAIGTQLLVALRVFVRMLLLFVPGIIEAIRDSLAMYVLSDHPEYNSSECIMVSQALMEGNKAKYAKLMLSLIGWAALAALPGAIHSALFGPSLDYAALASLPAADLQIALLNYESELLQYQSQLLPTIFSCLSIFVRAYALLISAAFFDLAAGNLTVRCEETDLSANYENYEIEDITDIDRNA